MKIVIYTVDEEEPDCMMCDHCTDGEYVCINHCGAEHGWNGYERTEYIEER